MSGFQASEGELRLAWRNWRLLSCLAIAGVVVSASGALQTDIEYANAGGESLRLDASVPDGPGPFPAVILVHGGAWVRGDKSGGPDKAYIAPLYEPLTRAGFAWFSINYRLAPTNRYPAGVDDVATAIRWVKSHASEFHVDPKRIAIAGESAGGHFAALAAMKTAPSNGLAAIVCFYTPFDIAGDAEPDAPMHPALVPLFGFTNRTHEAVALLQEASPLNYVKPGLPPFLLMHGTADSRVAFTQSSNLQVRLRAVGVSCDLITITNGEHNMVTWTNVNTDYKGKVVEWLDRVLSKPPEN